MARTINPQEYQEKRGQILDVAQRLIYTKGYEQLTIQDLLDELQISKGAFYHYFVSKQNLLEALIERMGSEAEQMFHGIVHGSSEPALVKLQQFFDASGRWKTAQKPFVLALLRVWHTDDNALVRLHVQAMMARRIVPLLAVLIAEGRREGVFTVTYPEQTAMIMLSLLTTMGDTFAQLLLSAAPDAFDQAARLTAACNDTMERVLGAPPGSLHLMDERTLREWYMAASDGVAVPAAPEV